MQQKGENAPQQEPNAVLAGIGENSRTRVGRLSAIRKQPSLRLAFHAHLLVYFVRFVKLRLNVSAIFSITSRELLENFLVSPTGLPDVQWEGPYDCVPKGGVAWLRGATESSILGSLFFATQKCRRLLRPSSQLVLHISPSPSSYTFRSLSQLRDSRIFHTQKRVGRKEKKFQLEKEGGYLLLLLRSVLFSAAPPSLKSERRRRRRRAGERAALGTLCDKKRQGLYCLVNTKGCGCQRGDGSRRRFSTIAMHLFPGPCLPSLQ